MVYELIYWPQLPGRGEYVRWILEEAMADYVDVARLPADHGGGVQAVLAYYQHRNKGFSIFAPPVLRHGTVVLAQMPLICRYLAERHGLSPQNEEDALHAEQLMLTIGDWVDEVHDTHHPLGSSLYYEEQHDAAKVRAKLFLDKRLPHFIDYFERVLSENGSDFLVGDRLSYVDLALAHTLRGIDYAFPKAHAKIIATAPALGALRERIERRPQIEAYLQSERWIGFNQAGIFRHYPELDFNDE